MIHFKNLLHWQDILLMNINIFSYLYASRALFHNANNTEVVDYFGTFCHIHSFLNSASCQYYKLRQCGLKVKVLFFLFLNLCLLFHCSFIE